MWLQASSKSIAQDVKQDAAQPMILSNVKPIPVFTRDTKMADVFILAYVDAIITKRSFKKILSCLNKKVKVKHLGDASYHLKIQIEKVYRSFIWSQKQKILEFLENLELNVANPMPTPIETSFHKQKKPCKLLPENNGYREARGKLLQLAIITRLDIVIALGIVHRKPAHPLRDWIGVIRVVRYLKKTAHLKFKLPATDSTRLVGQIKQKTVDHKSTSICIFLWKWSCKLSKLL